MIESLALWPGLTCLKDRDDKISCYTWDIETRRNLFQLWWYEGLTHKIDIAAEKKDCHFRIAPQHGELEVLESKEETQCVVKWTRIEVSFLPHWYGYPSKPGLEILIPSNQHPAVKKIIAQTEKEQKLRADKIIRLNGQIKLLELLRDINDKSHLKGRLKERQALLETKKLEYTRSIENMMQYKTIYCIAMYIIDICQESLFETNRAETDSIKRFKKLFSKTSQCKDFKHADKHEEKSQHVLSSLSESNSSPVSSDLKSPSSSSSAVLSSPSPSMFKSPTSQSKNFNREDKEKSRHVLSSLSVSNSSPISSDSKISPGILGLMNNLSSLSDSSKSLSLPRYSTRFISSSSSSCSSTSVPSSSSAALSSPSLSKFQRPPTSISLPASTSSSSSSSSSSTSAIGYQR